MENVIVNLNSRKMLPTYTDGQLTVLAARVGLTLDQLKQLHRFAQQTYQYIGADLAACSDSKRGIKRAVLVEVLLDADHITMACRNLPEELKRWLRVKSTQYPLDDIYAAVGAGFPYALYE